MPSEYIPPFKNKSSLPLWQIYDVKHVDTLKSQRLDSDPNCGIYSVVDVHTSQDKSQRLDSYPNCEFGVETKILVGFLAPARKKIP